MLISDHERDIGQIQQNFKSQNIMLSSLRLDAIISKLFKISREEGTSLFREERVFVNGKIITSNALKPKDGDIISVRKMGRFKYNGECGTSKKGKLVVSVNMFI